MTIKCPEEFEAAMAKAAEDDERVLSKYNRLVFDDAEPEAVNEVRNCIGAASRSLLRCLGSISGWDARGKERVFSESAVIVECGDERKVGHRDKPVVEVILCRDSSMPHSFYFREQWMDENTLKPLEVGDIRFFAFDGDVPVDEVDRMGADTMFHKYLNGECVLVGDYDAAERYKSEGWTVRRKVIMRRGIIGGIIYHPTYFKGDKMSYGTWSIHT